MCTHVHTYTRTRRKFSDNKSALQHCQTDFHHLSDTIHFYYPIAVQSISILAPPLIVPSVQTVIICHSFIVIFQLSFHHPIICQPSPIYYHCHPSSRTVYPRIIYHLYSMTSPTHHHINMSVQYIIKPCQFSIYLPHFPSAFSYTTDFCSINLHYNHFHYGNRIQTQSSAIPIMYNYSSELHKYSFV